MLKTDAAWVFTGCLEHLFNSHSLTPGDAAKVFLRLIAKINDEQNCLRFWRRILLTVDNLNAALQEKEGGHQN